MGKQPLSYGEASNDFAVALYRKLAREPGNLHFSPFSIRLALGMALAGARIREDSFHLAGGGTVRTAMMSDRKGIGYLKADGFRAVDLAYRGGQLSMLIVLPDRRDGLRDLESDLSASILHRTMVDMDTAGVEIHLPKFRITLGAELTESLSALGMPLAFDRDRADFSGINGLTPPHRDSLSLSAVVHKAFVEVNEEGTEAAAATVVGVVERASGGPRVPPLVFRADHPFLFAIRDPYSGMILFMGHVMDPTRDC